MTYSIIVTICFIIVFVLYVKTADKAGTLRAIIDSNSEKHKASEEMLFRKANDLAQDKDSMRRQIKWLESKLDDEKDRVMDLSGRIATQRDRMKHLRKALKDAQNELLMVSDLMHIKFTAVLPDGSHVKTLFKLGLGPCGLHVKSLRWTELDDRYLIDQLCTNGERKQFVYYKSEVVGRIEFRHGSAH